MTDGRKTIKDLLNLLFSRKFNVFDSVMMITLVTAYHHGVPGFTVLCISVVTVVLSVVFEDITRRMSK